jgi:endonuclease-8
MPEGDTILRSARSLDRWLSGRTITGARSQRVDVPPAALVGRTVERVEARAKHLMIRLSGGVTLHTHMMMTGSWHVYERGARWRLPAWQARLVLECGDHHSVCFNAPVVELLDEQLEREHPSLSGLGPDVLVEPLDVDEVIRRAALLPPDTEIGDLLLDQTVVSGIGNIYRCESLFMVRVHPRACVSAVSETQLRTLVTTASKVMSQNLVPAQGFSRSFGGERGRTWVYGRTGRPCARCGTPIISARTGRYARTAYWCPKCQRSRE